MSDPDDFDEFDHFDEPMDAHEAAMVEQDLADLELFEDTFREEGYRGMAVWCADCGEEHFYPWDMLRENLRLLLSTGEIPVHEPAFAPEPERYLQWDYARGYVDALRDAGLDQRASTSTCGRCGLELPIELGQGNFCPRCGTPLLVTRLRDALADAGLTDDAVARILEAAGLPNL